MDEVKNVGITGGNGFLGSYVLNKLIEEGFKPILFLRPQSDLWRIKDLVQYCEVCVLNNYKSDIQTAMNVHQIDCIIHLATEYGRNCSLSSLLQTNVIFPVSLIEEGAKKYLKLFINTDSFFAKSHFEQNYLKDYTNSKRFLERLLCDFSGEVHIVNLRLEHVFGEKDSEEKFFTSIIKRLLNNEDVIKLTQGEQKRDFIYADDVADAFISVIKNFGTLDKYKEFEVGNGSSISVRAFVQKIREIVGGQTTLDFGALPTREGDIPDSYAEIKELKKIGWNPKYGIDQAIHRIIEKEKERFKL